LIGTPFATAYGASKAAVSQMTKTTALFAATSGVRCNAVAPGQIDSPMLRGLFEHTARKEGVAPEAIETVFRGRIPGGHLGTARDVAMAALYLASDEASFINGTTLSVDGGESVQ
jgi:3(or 17)beta-hydroxysteroid dehydrogenase